MKKRVLNIVLVAIVALFSSNLKAQTAGTLTFTFTTPKHTTGNYVTDGRYVLAVWIQTSTGAFVKTKMRNCALGSTEDHLPTYGTNCGATAANCMTGGNITDGTSGATLTTFVAKTITWDGKNVSGAANGTLVADGAYRVAVQETWGHGASTAIRYFNFTKGPAADVQTPTADTNFTNISLNWSPTLANDTFSLSPSVVIYPNPTNGVVNIDLKNEVKNIRVINILGEIVYDEKVEAYAADSTKTLDLSNLTNGMYIVNVTNEYGSSNHKIVLNR
jgi:hypothetical protein